MTLFQEEHAVQLNYTLPRVVGQTWSSLFECVERVAQKHGVVDYSLSQTTLEQVSRLHGRIMSESLVHDVRIRVEL